MPRGQAVGVGPGPPLCFEQSLCGAIDVEAPRGEQAHVPPLADRVGRALARFEDDRGQAAFDQMRGGGEADRAGADHGDRGDRASGGVRHGGLLESRVTAGLAVASTHLTNISNYC
nr:hypothetical protein GCM10025732_07860 [Glycomyces mayteni]